MGCALTGGPEPFLPAGSFRIPARQGYTSGRFDHSHPVVNSEGDIVLLREARGFSRYVRPVYVDIYSKSGVRRSSTRLPHGGSVKQVVPGNHGETMFITHTKQFLMWYFVRVMRVESDGRLSGSWRWPDWLGEDRTESSLYGVHNVFVWGEWLTGVQYSNDSALPPIWIGSAKPAGAPPKLTPVEFHAWADVTRIQKQVSMPSLAFKGTRADLMRISQEEFKGRGESIPDHLELGALPFMTSPYQGTVRPTGGHTSVETHGFERMKTSGECLVVISIENPVGMSDDDHGAWTKEAGKINHPQQWLGGAWFDRTGRLRSWWLVPPDDPVCAAGWNILYELRYEDSGDIECRVWERRAK